MGGVFLGYCIRRQGLFFLKAFEADVPMICFFILFCFLPPNSNIKTQALICLDQATLSPLNYILCAIKENLLVKISSLHFPKYLHIYCLAFHWL